MKKDRPSEWVGLETDLESAVTTILFEQYGVLGVKLAMITDSGWPDHLYLGPNAKVVFVEFKRGDNERSPRQRFVHRLLRAFGFAVRTYRGDQHRIVREVLEALGLSARSHH